MGAVEYNPIFVVMAHHVVRDVQSLSFLINLLGAQPSNRTCIHQFLYLSAVGFGTLRILR